jgi:hypothetical protein
MERTGGLLGIFVYLDDLIKALESLGREKVKVHKVYSPVRSHRIMEALKMKPSLVRFFTLAGGIMGACTGFGLSVYTALQWRFIVSGKPIVPVLPYVIETFEFCILLGVFLNLGGILLLSRLPRTRLPEHYDPRFSEDRFGVVVLCGEGDKQRVSQILSHSGADEVYDL